MVGGLHLPKNLNLAKSNCGELWIPGANREFATAFLLIIISVFYAAIFAAGAFKNCTNYDSSEHSGGMSQQHIGTSIFLFDLHTIREKKLQFFIFSLFLGPLYGWGKFVKFEYGCTIAFFDSSANGRWAKNLFFFLIFIALQNLLAVHIYKLWYNFRSYVISTLIAVLFLPFGDHTCNEKQFWYWDWKIDIEFV